MHKKMALWVSLLALVVAAPSLLAAGVSNTDNTPDDWKYTLIIDSTHQAGDLSWTLTGIFAEADIVSIGIPSAKWSTATADNTVTWNYDGPGDINPNPDEGFEVTGFSLTMAAGKYMNDPLQSFLITDTEDATSGTIDAPVPIPEASTFALFGVGIVGLVGFCRRKRQ